MSKVGKHPVSIPAGVSVSLEKDKLVISSKSLKSEVAIPEGVLVEIKDSHVICTIDNITKELKSQWGTVRSLINNAILGIVTPFVQKLNLVGVGYKAAINGNFVDLQLAYSHGISVPIPQGVSVKVDKQTVIIVSSHDKQLLGAFLRKLQSYRPPEPYKGKGIIIEGQYVYRKEGKKK